jgi:hypothetical protein
MSDKFEIQKLAQTVDDLHPTCARCGQKLTGWHLRQAVEASKADKANPFDEDKFRRLFASTQDRGAIAAATRMVREGWRPALDELGIGYTGN